ncbi:MAG TPA: alpha/beta hydrolase [Opitutales bacterium]|jgi:acetyl esterase/lipase|nr:alpha/beta hydrolase [Opitutales bacterium]
MKTPTVTALLFATLLTPFAMSAADAPAPAANSATPSSAAPAPAAASDTGTPAATTPPLQDKQIFRLWAGDAPLQHGQDTTKDIPTIQAYLADPAKATGAAIIIFPGGGYTNLSMANEGTTIAAWLNSNGITAFVVKYRLGSNGYHHPAEMDDGQRAVRFVRTYAPAWNIDPNRIGVIGFSAGGHMASTLATHFDQGDPTAADFIDRAGCRPNLQILLYPVVTMMDEATVHKGSRTQLLGMDPSDDLKQLLSGELQVTRDTPPAFICHSSADPVVPIGNSDAYVAALEKNNVPVVYLRGPYGGHGFGLKDFWNAQCIAWLRTQKF